MSETNNQNPDSKLVGLLAQFDDPDSLIHACNEAREKGYKKFDAFTPFPVHGIDPAIGIKRTMLPFIVLAVGLGAVVMGVGMQWYTNGGSIFGFRTDESPVFPGYPFMISGKPFFSLPANIPVAFEVIVLSSAFATFFGMWIMNCLPRLSNPLHRVSRFKRVTNDKFFLMIEERDGLFGRDETEAQLNEWGAVATEEVRQDLTDTKLPSWLKLAGVLGAILLLLPPVAIYRAQGMTNRQPRLHVMPDMDWQEKYKAQQMAPVIAEDHGQPQYLFNDFRAARAPVVGSVPWGHLETDTEMYQGVKKDWKPKVTTVSSTQQTFTSTAAQDDEKAAADKPDAAAEEDLSMYLEVFPSDIDVDADFVAHGRQRFEIYCSACHGYAGNGDGLVNQRAMALNVGGKALWTTAKSLHEPDVKDAAKNPVGRIFDTISNGRNTMGPYGDQIPAEDRWAIVAYVKALQETGIKPPSVVAAEAEEAKVKAKAKDK